MNDLQRCSLGFGLQEQRKLICFEMLEFRS